MSDEAEDHEEYEARVGTSAGHWAISKLIGVGGMAAVYRATHAENHTVAALKILHDQFAGRTRVTKRFLREAHIANAIDHDGAVGVLGQGTTPDGCPFLVMELLEGETVEDIIKRAGHLPLSQALGVADEVLSVLSAAHAKGIVHRDIKPENIFITNQRRLKLLDFGIARLADYADMKKTSTGSLMGTPTFMPPEQALGRMSDVGPHTDIWAVGAVIFNLLSGSTVHTGESAGEVLVAAASQPARSLAEVVPNAPPELVELVDEALAYDIANRIPDAIAMRRRIREVIARLHRGGGLPRDSRAPTPPLRDASSRPSWIPDHETTSRPRSTLELAHEKIEGVEVRDLSDHDIQLTARAWEAIDGALTARLHYGDEHPQALQRFEAAWELLRRAVAETEAGVLWNVTPFSFHVARVTVWEPRDQLDQIPYRMFASGIRAMGFVRGLSREEFDGFIDLLAMDPLAEMAPEDDLVTLLWEGGYDHVLYREVDSFSEGDQAEREVFEEQRREVAAFVRAAQRGAMELDVGRAPNKRTTAIHELEDHIEDAGGFAAAQAAARRAARARDRDSESSAVTDLVSLDEAALRVLRVELDRGEESTGERFVFAAAHGYVWAAGQGQERALAQALRLTVEGVALENAPAALRLAQSLLSTLRLRDPEHTKLRRSELATSLISGEVLRAIQPRLDDPTAGDLRQLLAQLLALVQPSAVDGYLDVAESLRPGATLDTLCAFVGRSAAGHEDTIGELVERARPDLALALCRMLRGLQSPKANEALARAAKNPDALVRLEAINSASGGPGTATRARRELEQLIGGDDVQLRAQTLPTIVANGIREAAPILAAMVNEKTFDRRSLDDRTRIFEALAALQPERAEPIALNLLTGRKLVSTNAHEDTRVLAARIIGAVGKSRHTLEAVETVARARFGVTTPVREAAEAAAAEMRRRAAAEVLR